MGVHWKSAKWSRNPFSFDIIDGVPHLALYTRDREARQNQPRTDYRAQFLRSVNGQWIDLPQAEFPLDKALMNLSGDYWRHSTAIDCKSLIRWEGKRLPSWPTDTIRSYFERDHNYCSIYTNSTAETGNLMATLIDYALLSADVYSNSPEVRGEENTVSISKESRS